MDYETQLSFYNAQEAYLFLKRKYKMILDDICHGVYIWGTGRLGRYAEEQCKKNGIVVRGFIDNDKKKQQEERNVYSSSVLKNDDVVIIATISYWEIAKQLEKLSCKIKHIYYEVLAKADNKFESYYAGFINLFEEMEQYKREYIDILSMCEDEVSYIVLGNILMYRMTLDIEYIEEAYRLSHQYGKQDFDKVITDRLNNKTVFCDVGGFDGETTAQYLQLLPGVEKIILFEPDRNEMQRAREKLHDYKQIDYVNAAVGEKEHKGYLCSVGAGASSVTDSARKGDYEIQVVALDQYIRSGNTYIKMDVEGYETKAIAGAKNAIRAYKPLLGISLYHVPGDIHRLTKQILSYRKDYRIYFRHYTLSYADTMGYFV